MTVTPEQSWSVLSARTDRLRLGGRDVEELDIVARALHVAVHAAACGPTPDRARQDLRRAIDRLSCSTWREAAAMAIALGAESAFIDMSSTIVMSAWLLRRLGLHRAGGRVVL